MGVIQHGWAIFLVVCGVLAVIFKKFWPELKRMLTLYLRNRVTKGIETDLRKGAPPVRLNFFESDVRKHLGLFKFLYLPVMDDLESRKWCARVEGVFPDRGDCWMRL